MSKVRQVLKSNDHTAGEKEEGHKGPGRAAEL